MTFHPDTLPDLEGKVFIVTGGNSGMGYYTVAHLAKHGAHVYMCARSLEKGRSAIADIQKMHPSANIDLLQMDLMDLTSVVAAAKHFFTLETTLHGLVNNADASPGSVRIVNLTSSGHLSAPKGGINFKDPSLKERSTWARYGQSKLASILHTRTLHKTYGPGSPSARNGEGEIWVSSVHPGLVQTNLATSVGESGSGMMRIFSALGMFGMMWPADKGSWTSLFCAASQDMKAEQSGEYFEIFRRFGEPRCQSSAAKDEKLAGTLTEWTRDVTRKEGWIQ
ncbi:short-chain dehydrogenase protein [Seiridium cupressi]